MAGAAAISTEASGVALERVLVAFAGPAAEPPHDASAGIVVDRIADPVAPFVALFGNVRPRRGETPPDAQVRYEAVVARLESEPVRAELVSWMALKARGVAFTGRRALLGRLRSRFVQVPASFLVVPRPEPPDSAAPAGDGCRYSGIDVDVNVK